MIGLTFSGGILFSITLIGQLTSFVSSGTSLYDWIKNAAAGIIMFVGLSYLIGYEPEMLFIRRDIKEKDSKGDSGLMACENPYGVS